MDRARYLFGLLVLAIAMAGGYFLYGLVRDGEVQGFPLQVEFANIGGLKKGADVKYRGVRVGHVQTIALTSDGSRASVAVMLESRWQKLVRDNSHFWVVTPRFHGLQGGLTGLDTLVRSSYVAFVTPEPSGTPLRAHAQLVGEDRPFQVEKAQDLPTVEHGDLLMHVLLPQNHGLSVGGQVQFRGMVTGEIRAVRLSKVGTHVEVTVRIDKNYRTTVTEASRFWVARPRLSGAIFTGLALRDVQALLGPYLAYHTRPDSGVPAPDGFRVAGLSESPDLDLELPRSALRQTDDSGAGTDDWGEHAIVLVKYTAEDVDWFSANDRINRQGTGILYSDKQGRALVLTTRSVCDARYDFEDFFGEADIRGEEIRVRLPGGQWLRASRLAVADQDKDLAVLTLTGSPTRLQPTKLDRFAFPEKLPDGLDGLTYKAVNADGVTLPERQLDVSHKAADKELRRGAVLLQGKQVIGLLGRTSKKDAGWALVPLRFLPESLRPGS